MEVKRMELEDIHHIPVDNIQDQTRVDWEERILVGNTLNQTRMDKEETLVNRQILMTNIQ